MLEQLTDYAYYLPAEATTDRPLLGVVRGSRYTLLIDGGNSQAHADKLQQAISFPIDFIAVTHSHWDHVFGLSEFSAPVVTERRIADNLRHLQTLTWDDAALESRVQTGEEIPFCRDMIQAELPERDGNPRQVTIRGADVVFEGRLELNLGGICCELVHVGGEHAADSVVIYAYPEHQRQGGVLFLGDCLYQNLYNGHSDASYDMQSLRALLTQIAKFPAAWFVWSHHEKPQNAQEYKQEVEELSAVGMTVEAYGFDGYAVLEMLSRRYGLRPTDDVREMVRMFQLGLQLRQDQKS